MNKIGECSGEFKEGEDHPCAGADFIEWGSGSTGWLYKYQIEATKAILKGLEFRLVYNFKRLKVIYDFSLVRGDNMIDKTPLPYINPDKHILMINYGNEITKNTIRFSKVEAQNRLGEFETYTPSSFLVDYIFSYKKRNQNISIQINNIFNEKYYNHLSRIKSIMPEPGRNISLNYKFILF
tara:strand:+ start:51 stop:593 length:543 start_codon:yes stop_codon:yes gene_type:complete